MKRKLFVLAVFIFLILTAVPSAMAACSHRWMTESYTAPTCTADGKSVQRCMVCGASKTSTPSKLGHNKKTNTTNASCSEAGKKVTYCTRSGCNYTKVETIPKVAHSFGKWTTKKAPTCSSTGIEKRVCSVCTYEENRPITYKDPGNHSNLDKVVPTKPSTCTETGSGYRLCKACKEKVTVTIAKKAHDYGNWTTKKAPTCSSTGIEKRVCSVCSYEENKPIAYKDPGNHSKLGDVEPTNDSTCTEIGSGYRVCTACKEKVTVTIPRKPHEYSNWTTKKAPTCSSTGIEKRVCSVCGNEENRPITYKDPGNHSNLGDLEIDYDSTCTEEGKGYRVCRACGEKVTVTISTKPHDYGDWTTIIPPTCSSIGIKGRLCTECGEEAPDRQPITYLDPANHSSLGEWKTTKEPSCVEGEEQATCSVCGVTVTHSLEPIRDHKYGNWMLNSASMLIMKPVAVRICSCGNREYGDAQNAKYKVDYDPSQDPDRKSFTYNGEVFQLASLEDDKSHYVITDDRGNEFHFSYYEPRITSTSSGNNGTVVAEDHSPESQLNAWNAIANFGTLPSDNSTVIKPGNGVFKDGVNRQSPTTSAGGAAVILSAAVEFAGNLRENVNYVTVSLVENVDGSKNAVITVNHKDIEKIIKEEGGSRTQGSEATGYTTWTLSQDRIKADGSIDDTVGIVKQDKDGKLIALPAYGDAVTHQSHYWDATTQSVNIVAQELPEDLCQRIEEVIQRMNASSPNSGASRSLAPSEAPSLPPESESIPEPTPIPEPATPTDLMSL